MSMIKILIPLMICLSVGLSGWTYGSNIIANGDFSEARYVYGQPNLLPNPNFTDNITGWDEEGATWVNDSGNGIANLTGYYLMPDPYGELGNVNEGEYFYWSFWFKTDNASAYIQADMDGANDIFVNTTHVCGYQDCPNFPSFLDADATAITAQGDGWYKFETVFHAPSNSAELVGYYESYAIDPQPTPRWASVQVDNVVVMNLTVLPANWSSFDVSAWACDDISGTSSSWEFGNYTDGMMNISTTWDSLYTLAYDNLVLDNDSDFYYAQFEFYPYKDGAIDDNIYIDFDLYNKSAICNVDWMNELDVNTTLAREQVGLDSPLFVNPIVTDIGGGWKRMSGLLNMTGLYGYYGYYGGVRGDGDAIGVLQFWGDYQYLLDNVEIRLATYTSDYVPPQGWSGATAHSVVGFAPIIIGLGIVAGMLSMFLMRSEDDSMVALVMRGGVIALISVVMLGILASVIG